MSNPHLQGRGKTVPGGGGPPETTSAGRGSGHIGRGTSRFQTRPSTLQPRQRFDGDIPELQGKTYELVGNKSADLYTETTKHIASYVAIKCQHGGDIRRVVETRARPTMTAPNRTTIATQLGIPETTTVGDGETARIVIDPLVQMMFAEEVKEHVKRTRKLEENIKFLWTVLWAQSSQAVRNRLEALNTYETMKQESDGLALLIAIKDLLYNVQDRKYIPLSIHLANDNSISIVRDEQHPLPVITNNLIILLICWSTVEQVLGKMMELSPRYSNTMVSIQQLLQRLKKRMHELRLKNGTMVWPS